MITKRHNHKYPHFLLKNWSLNPYSKYENRRVLYKKARHMGEKNYYPDELEDKLAKVEMMVSAIFRKIISKNYKLSKLEIARMIIYVKIQTIRLGNIIEYINEPDMQFPGNNNFLFGVHSSNKKEEIISLTNYYCDHFLLDKVNKIDKTLILTGISPVIWESKENIFCVTDNAVFKEVDLDGRFLFLLLPLSPKCAIVLSKNSYFSSLKNLKAIKTINKDTRMSMSVNDNLLINNYKHSSISHKSFSAGTPSNIPVYKIKKKDIFKINSAFMKDAKKLIFYDGKDEDIKKYIKYNDPSREIVNYE